jgi:hypothetical protein
MARDYTLYAGSKRPKALLLHNASRTMQVAQGKPHKASGTVNRAGSRLPKALLLHNASCTMQAAQYKQHTASRTMQAALTGGLVVFCCAAQASQGNLLRDWFFGFLILMRPYCIV